MKEKWFYDISLDRPPLPASCQQQKLYMNIQTGNDMRKERMDRGARSIPQADDFFRYIGPLHPGFRPIVTDIFLERVPLKKVENPFGNKPGTGR